MSDGIAIAMEVEPTPTPTPTPGPTAPPAPTPTPTPSPPTDEDEEDISDLLTLFQSTESSDPPSSPSTKIATLREILLEPLCRYGPSATSLKERAIYSLARLHSQPPLASESHLVSLLTGPTCQPFLQNVTRAKCAKVVRAVLDIILSSTPTLSTQTTICRSILEWCEEQKRTFLRQRVQARLASVLFRAGEYGEALELVKSLLVELKRIDDKQLLVEAHLVECKVHHGLRSLSRAKAALTASRTCANAIYVSPLVQAGIDEISGVLHCEEGDYNTAHSYFLEGFEQLDQLEDQRKAAKDGEGGGGRARMCLNYMMLCKILDAVVKALKVSSTGVPGAKSSRAESDITTLITPRQAVKYAGKSIEAMTAIASAASSRSLSQYTSVLAQYHTELSSDLLIKHHLSFLREQLLESNLIRIVEPYSVVEIRHVAEKIGIMEAGEVERKLSQMILDGKLRGILDQGKGRLIVYEEGERDLAMEGGLKVIENMDRVVTSLFKRSRALGSVVH